MNPSDTEIMQQLIKAHTKNMITGRIDPQTKVIWGRSKFGGRPDVPIDFDWPTYTCTSFDCDEAYQQPLTFIAQFDCRALSALDTEHFLPDTGLLSFFYELNTSPDGSRREDSGGARVFWFDGSKPLVPATLPEDADPDFQLPRIPLEIRSARSFPDFDTLMMNDHEHQSEALYEAYQHIYEQSTCPDLDIKLLGHPNPVFDMLFLSCELIREGFPIEEGIEFLPVQVLEQAQQNAADWCLLLELHTSGNDLLCFEDACLSFCIRAQDLKAKRFDRIWAMLQWF